MTKNEKVIKLLRQIKKVKDLCLGQPNFTEKYKDTIKLHFSYLIGLYRKGFQDNYELELDLIRIELMEIFEFGDPKQKKLAEIQCQINIIENKNKRQPKAA